MQNLILLHGAIGASDQLQQLAKQLGQHFNVHSFSFSGHGGNAFPSEPFSIRLFADDVLAYMEKHGIELAHFFGYSMGGYVAMYLARHCSSKVGKVVTLATKYHWDETIAAKEIQMINPEKLLAKVPAFVDSLKSRHAPNHWQELLARTAALLESLGKQNTLTLDNYKEIVTPCLVLIGDRDKMITMEETIDVYKALPNGQMGMMPGTPHPVEQVNCRLLASMITEFLQ